MREAEVNIYQSFSQHFQLRNLLWDIYCAREVKLRLSALFWQFLFLLPSFTWVLCASSSRTSARLGSFRWRGQGMYWVESAVRVCVCACKTEQKKEENKRSQCENVNMHAHLCVCKYMLGLMALQLLGLSSWWLSIVS